MELFTTRATPIKEDLSPMQGLGLEQLSMAQLDVLEGLHHAALTAIASRRLDLVSILRNLSRNGPRFCGWPGG